MSGRDAPGPIRGRIERRLRGRIDGRETRTNEREFEEAPSEEDSSEVELTFASRELEPGAPPAGHLRPLAGAFLELARALTEEEREEDER